MGLTDLGVLGAADTTGPTEMPGWGPRSEVGGERCLEGLGAGVLGRLGRWQVAGGARWGSRVVKEAPVLWAALGFCGAAKWSEGISGSPHWLGMNWRGGSGGQAGTHGTSRTQTPIPPPVHLAGTSGAARARENTWLVGGLPGAGATEETPGHRGHRGPRPRSQRRRAEAGSSGAAPVSMTVPWKQTLRRVRPQEMGRALAGQTQGGGALRPGTAEPILGPGDRCTPRPRRAGRGLPLKQTPPLPGFGDRRAAHLFSQHSFHWRLPREGPRLCPLQRTPPEDRNFPSDTPSPPRGQQLSSPRVTPQPGASARPEVGTRRGVVPTPSPGARRCPTGPVLGLGGELGVPRVPRCRPACPSRSGCIPRASQEET